MSNSERHKEKRRQRAKMKRRPGTGEGRDRGSKVHCHYHEAPRVPAFFGLMVIVRQALAKRRAKDNPLGISDKEKRGLTPRKVA